MWLDRIELMIYRQIPANGISNAQLEIEFGRDVIPRYLKRMIAEGIVKQETRQGKLFWLKMVEL